MNTSANNNERESRLVPHYVHFVSALRDADALLARYLGPLHPVRAEIQTMIDARLQHENSSRSTEALERSQPTLTITEADPVAVDRVQPAKIETTVFPPSANYARPKASRRAVPRVGNFNEGYKLP